MVMQLGLFSAIVGFAAEYLLDYGISATGLETQVIVGRAVDAFKNGMLVGGLYIGFPVWLALENFKKREDG